jgi:hypothetical protein
MTQPDSSVLFGSESFDFVIVVVRSFESVVYLRIFRLVKFTLFIGPTIHEVCYRSKTQHILCLLASLAASNVSASLLGRASLEVYLHKRLRIDTKSFM